MKQEHIIHPIPPFYDGDSEILILGSFPSIKTRESGFFYGHPQNRFWKVMAALFHEDVPAGVEERRALAAKHHIALWDSIHECDIVGSSDSSIKNAVPNDIRLILDAADIRMIVTNGRKSHEIYRKYCMEMTMREDVTLPSTSPANAAWTLEKLVSAWSVILPASAGELRGQ